MNSLRYAALKFGESDAGTGRLSHFFVHAIIGCSSVKYDNLVATRSVEFLVFSGICFEETVNFW